MEHLLQPGVLLDGRYRVDYVLGEGGFGITYAAENTRIGLKVAIKELFWRDHSVRNMAVSPEIVLSRTQDVTVFQKQKDRFLREARTLRSFSGLPGIYSRHGSGLHGLQPQQTSLRVPHTARGRRGLP